MQLINNLRTLVKMLAAFSLVIIFSLVVNTLSWSSLSSQQPANGWTVHTYEVLKRIDAIVAAMVDRETGVRGFLISGNDDFLEPYNAGEKAFQGAFDDVVKLTSDNSAQQKRISDLNALMKG